MTNAKELIDSSIKHLPGCEECDKVKRKRLLDDDSLCPLVSAADGLKVRCVGKWAGDKVYHLLQYFQLFVESMKNKWSGNLTYIEVCSGPGTCCTRDKQEQDGTALAIVKNPCFKHLKSALFFDYSQSVIDELKKRIINCGCGDKAFAIRGDYNDPKTITEPLRHYGAHGLYLCFIDPTDCSVPFETVEQIYRATNNKCDFIISFFDQEDFNRNGRDAALSPNFSKAREKYLKFLGADGFFDRQDVIRIALAGKNQDLSGLFREAYVGQMARLGLKYSGWITIDKYYRLLFVSGSKLGLEFWKEASKIDPRGQKQLGLGI